MHQKLEMMMLRAGAPSFRFAFWRFDRKCDFLEQIVKESADKNSLDDHAERLHAEHLALSN